MPLDVFVGRDGERRALDALLDAHRLVSLVGPPGIGKTRLAIEVARSVERPVVLVEATSCPSHDAFVFALAEALGMSVHSSGPLPAVCERIGRVLATRGPLLLLLDNLEHLVAASAETIGGWLLRSPQVGVLATSRVPLALAGEHILQVPPLELPGAEVAPEAAPAVSLLLHRTRERTGCWQPTDTELSELAALSHAVRGVPLALELAAGQIAQHGLTETLRDVAGVSSWVSDRRDADRRHQTVADALASSWRLLDTASQRALARLSVLPGAIGLDGAEVVLAERRWRDRLVDLRRASLLSVIGPARWRVHLGTHEMVRAQAPEQCAEAERLWSNWVASRARAWLATLDGPRGVEAYARVLAHARALRLAALRADALGMPAAATVCVVVLARVGVHPQEFIDLAERLSASHAQASDRTDPQPRDMLALLTVRGMQLTLHRRLPEALGCWEGVLLRCAGSDQRHWARSTAGRLLVEFLLRTGRREDALRWHARALEDTPCMGPEADQALALVAMDDDRLVDAERLLNAAQRALTARGEVSLASLLFLRRARLLAVCRAPDAHRSAHESVQRARRMGVPRLLAYAQMTAAISLWDRGHLAGALDALARIRAIYQREGFASGEDPATIGILVALELGDVAAAQRALADLDDRGLPTADRWSPRLEAYRALLLGLRGEPLEALTQLEPEGGPTGDPLVARVCDILGVLVGRPAREPGSAPSSMMFGPAERSLARLAARARAGLDLTRPVIAVDARGASFRVGAGPETTAPTHAGYRAMLACLARAHHAGTPFRTVDALVEAAWPGERMTARSALNRVRVAVAALRRAGLSGLIVTRPGGYALDPSAEVRWPAEQRADAPYRRAVVDEPRTGLTGGSVVRGGTR